MCWWSKKLKTSYGTKIDGKDVPGLPDANVYNAALAVLVGACGQGGIDAQKAATALDGIIVEWWDRIAPRPSTGELNTVVVQNGNVYSGLTVGTLCMVAWRGKIFRSAFCHEILHVIAGRVLGDPDANHQNEKLWAIEKIARKALEEKDI